MIKKKIHVRPRAERDRAKASCQKIDVATPKYKGERPTLYNRHEGNQYPAGIPPSFFFLLFFISFRLNNKAFSFLWLNCTLFFFYPADKLYNCQARIFFFSTIESREKLVYKANIIIIIVNNTKAKRERQSAIEKREREREEKEFTVWKIHDWKEIVVYPTTIRTVGLRSDDSQVRD